MIACIMRIRANFIGPPFFAASVMQCAAVLFVRSDFATNQPYVRFRPCLVPKESWSDLARVVRARRAADPFGRVRLLKLVRKFSIAKGVLNNGTVHYQW